MNDLERRFYWILSLGLVNLALNLMCMAQVIQNLFIGRFCLLLSCAYLVAVVRFCWLCCHPKEETK